ncbi:cysteine desulfurase SufS [Clostridium homopropionicum DSM 5847]|uniref:cysteine desulfurase n=1 Tax=Clostridium homopropionicum DSM 5847 TaxID=1121318 RepID=A0A0L6ZBB2_9CLOT|nr:aminotransferase class V-fold PLP-dependent enzyme [Clostridium homopropionicum]KOA20250.1 cysteine desulfurase SufS [Clostridium homopropionicum DSM 5847]SFG57586.1 cysteine desulfurase family protein [Clostridium homopropionicum]
MIYFDNAATSFPKPTSVYDSVDYCLRNYCSNPNRGSHNLSIKCELKIIECRERLAKLLNVDDPMQIVFTSNATDSLNIAIKGALKPGDHVITTMIEHNSVLRPLESLKKIGIETTFLPVDLYGYISIDDIKNSIKKNTKAIIINHGSNVLGTIQDIEVIGRLSKSLGILLIVDGAQTVGYIDIDVKKMNIDILAFPGHKSLFGLQGTGGLYVSKEIDLLPLKEGGTGSNSSSLLQPSFMPDKLESGTMNTPGIIGLSEGVNFLFTENLIKIREHEIALIKYLTEELLKLPFINIYGELDAPKKTPVISFNVEGFDSSEMGAFLSQHNICVRTGYHCAPMIHKIIGTDKRGTIRISPGYFNCFKDVENFIDTIIQIFNMHF